jgi:GNAT superfamily N-acetyltransferase
MPARRNHPTVRPARADEAVALAAVHLASWQAAYAPLIPAVFVEGIDPAVWEAKWRAWLADEQVRASVLDASGEIVGLSLVGPSRDADRAGWGELRLLYLLPEIWGSGAARLLHRVALSDLVRLGHEHLLLWVFRDNPRARGFYEQQGWALIEGARDAIFDGVGVAEVRYALSPAGPPPESRSG